VTTWRNSWITTWFGTWFGPIGVVLISPAPAPIIRPPTYQPSYDSLDLSPVCDIIEESATADVMMLTGLTDVTQSILIHRFPLSRVRQPTYQVRPDEHEIVDLSPGGDARFVDDTEMLDLSPFADLELPVEWR